MAIDRRRLAGWGASGVAALLDQGCFAAGNFAINLALVRTLQPAAYGQFAVVYGVLIFVAVLHEALFAEPMLVYASQKYAAVRRAYLHRLLTIHVVLLSALCTAALLGALMARVAGFHDLALASAGLMITAPTTTAFWFLRRACYVSRNVWLAVASSAGYGVFALSATLVLSSLDRLTTMTAFVTVALASGLAAALLVVRLGLVSLPDVVPWREVVRKHWGYGRWALATNGVGWVPTNIYLMLLPIWWGLGATAELKAMSNIAMPALLAIASLNLLLLPTLSRRSGTPAERKIITGALVLQVTGGALFWLFVNLFREQIARVLYGDKYTGSASVLIALGAIPMITCVSAVCANVLRSRDAPNLLFFTVAAPAVLALTAGSYLVYRFGLMGAALGMVLTNIVQAAGTGWLAARAPHRPPSPSAITIPADTAPATTITKQRVG